MSITSSQRRRSGFTLLEIMIALTAGGIAIGAIYSIGAASTKHFRQQQRISVTQTSLRQAMDQLKRDFARAGFLATPNAAIANETCAQPSPAINDTNTNPPRRLAAISGYTQGDTQGSQEPTSLDPDNLNKWDGVDIVYLMGNYATTGEYPILSLAADNITVTLVQDSQSYRRDFTEWTGATAGSCNLDAFTAAFPVGRMVRVHTLTERNFYSKVQSVTCAGTAAATVVLTDAVPASCTVANGWISPVNTLRYSVVNATGVQVSRTGDNRVAVLRRTEVKPDDKDNVLPQPGSLVPMDDRAILDSVVNFRISFMMRQTASRVVNFAPSTDLLVRANPEQVRGVIIDLSARTPEHELDFFNTGTNLVFQVLPGVQGAARVRRLRAEVMMPNIAYRQL
jgi:prepilin-type N-terminal cleavage/methylation domain-containing protein